MKDALVRIFSSAKVWTALIAVAVVAGLVSLDVSDKLVGLVGAIFVALQLGQAANDHGKGAAEINAAAPAKPAQQVAQGDIVNNTPAAAPALTEAAP